MIPQNLFFKPYACCIPVKGFGRSIIYDLNRSVFTYIPNSLFEIMKEHQGQTVAQIKQSVEPYYWDILDKYFDFLLQNEFILLANAKEELNLFPALELSYQSPSSISNAIIQIKETVTINLPHLIEELSVLGCRAIQIVFYGEGDVNFLSKVLTLFDKSRIGSIEVFMKYNENISESILDQIINKFRRIHKLTLYAATKDLIFRNFHFRMQAISFITRSIDYRLQMPIKDTSNFRTNIDLFCESQKFNTYFNQKVVIDINGNIKNAPNTEISFGNVNDQSLAEIIHTEEFQALWHIKKDDIEICNLCEYRYMCVDNRIPKKKENKWVHSEKCNYDVYKCQWNTNSLT